MSLIITRGFGPENETTSIPIIVEVVCLDSTTLRVTFLEPVVLEYPADTDSSWTIRPLTSQDEMAVLSLDHQDNVITLTTTRHIEGHRYVLIVPNLGIIDADLGGRYAGPFTFEYGGVDLPPYIVIVKGIDQTAIDVVFSEPVMTEEALEPTNYTVIGPDVVKVLAVEKVSDITYRLTTTKQTRLVSYTVAVENIHDLYGNAIVSDHS